jgi:two-component system OmpR family sensor kinase
VVNSVSCPAYLDGVAYNALLPANIAVLVAAGPVYFSTGSTQANGPQFRVEAVRLAGNGVLIVSQPLAAEGDTLQRLLYVEFTVALAAMVIALLGGWVLVNRGLAPLAEMERTAESIAGGLAEAERRAGVGSGDEVVGGLSERVPGGRGTTEVDRLAGTLNSMLDRIEVAFAARVETEDQLRQFVADASHELRTPIAAISAYAELFDRGGRDNANDLERLMMGIRSETGRMGRLVGDLLLLARLDEGEEQAVVPVELSVMCAEAAATAQMVGPAWPVEFETEGPVYVVGDEGALRQVLDNLLGNVRAHTPAGTHCLVKFDTVGAEAVISVADDGDGIAPERLGHVFERFWRSDPARSRDLGGSGLGLAIVRSLVESQGGSVRVESELGRGTIFSIRMPLLANPDESAAQGDTQ